MTPERIAEFRDAIANHPHFGIGGDALSKILDALEAAQAEISDLKRGGVVVDREEFDLLRKIEEMWLPPFGVPHNPESIALFDALRALRAQPTQEPAP